VAKALGVPSWQRALVVLTGTVVGVVGVSCLYWAQRVFIPVALAVFLTFLLALSLRSFISRFLLMQLIVNAGFGVLLALGLLLIRVPHALLWGCLAARLRYVPYLGSWLTTVLLMTLSLAMFPGWVQPFLVLGLIVILELVTANVVEPRLFGHSIGVSEVALLVAAAFWAFLWGPIGLLLSSPLTVCLVVLGKYVPQLEFLDVILGDKPSLGADISYYQRLLARDQDEAAQLVLTQAKIAPPEQIYDQLLMPALNYLKRDRQRDDLTEADQQFVLRATREIVEDLGERRTGRRQRSGWQRCDRSPRRKGSIADRNS
jgi:hypothetical protein